MSKDWSNIKIALFGDNGKIGTSFEQGDNNKINKTTYKVKAKGDVNIYFGNNAELMKKVDEVAMESFFEDDAPASLGASIKENLLESFNQDKTPEESINRIDVIEKIVKTPGLKKSHKEKLIYLLNNSVKDKEDWKEEIYGVIFKWYSDKNDSEIELLDFLNEFDRMTKKEFENLLRLLSWLKIVSMINSDRFTINKWIMNNEERDSNIKDLWDLFQSKGETNYATLKGTFTSLNQKYSLFITGSSYVNIDSNSPDNVSNVYGYPTTDRGIEWLVLLQGPLGKEINFFLKLLIDSGYLNFR